jgi:hypothetical protein
LRLSLIYFTLIAFGFPFGAFIHECGHFTAATAFGWNATFYAAFVGWSHSTPPSALAVVVFLLAGVLVDVIFVSKGLFLLAKHKRTPPRQFDWPILIGTLLTAFSIRWSISPVFVLLNSSDEARMSSALGLNQWVIPICTLPIGIGIAIYVISVHIRNKSVIPLMTGAFGAFCGMGLWVNIVGPALFGR